MENNNENLTNQYNNNGSYDKLAFPSKFFHI